MTLDDDPTGYMQVIDVDGARLERAKANLDRIEFVGLTERYGDLVDDLSHHFGWRLARDARANVSPDHDEPVDEAFRERIAFDNMFDVELYEYAKDLVSRRRSGT
jgi:hypothetical protein